MITPPAASPQLTGVPFAQLLASFGDRTAIVADGATVSYRQLADRVAATAQRLGSGRRLVMIAAANELEPIVTYLAAVAAGHAVLIVEAGSPHVDELARTYDPDVVAAPMRGEWSIEERRAGSAHTLHPDLALLLSTSGSTGSPKLVRLSCRNLQSNAEAIGEYLGIRETDRAITTLPMHYCYGLSVINSHLARGAAVVLTGLSVVDDSFWGLVRDQRVTSFAGVPYTFDLLDRVGFERMQLPSLRYVTQAGGRLDPERVRRYAELGQRDGWDLFVMYGQTEATARMAYLPPDLARSNPQAIGVPIRGGSFTLDPISDGDGCELVYEGPNVMLGYAECPGDLALGATVGALRTGDLARRTADGLYELTGRRSSFLKICGLRIDPQRAVSALAASQLTGCCWGDDTGLNAAVVAPADPDVARQVVAEACGLPPRTVRVVTVGALPRLASGKLDYYALERLADAAPPVEPEPAAMVGNADLRKLYAEILDVDNVTDDTSFVGLGGDSLSYVEVSIRLEEVLGELPAGWHALPIRELTAPSPGRPRRGRSVDMSIVLRAVSIVLVVGTHATLFTVQGGAHLLLGVAGYNFARFQLTGAPRTVRTRHLAASTGRIAAATVSWIALASMLTPGKYSLANLLLINNVVGPDHMDAVWRYWFAETLVWLLVAVGAVMAVPWVDRFERRHPLALPMILVGLGLLTRYELIVIDGGIQNLLAHVVLWLFALGWAAASAATTKQRLAVSAAVTVTLPGFFDSGVREAIVIVGLLLLIWVPTVRIPRLFGWPLGALASCSLYIYLTHWHVFPYLKNISTLLAVVASLAVGVLYAKTVRVLASGAWARIRRALKHQLARSASDHLPVVVEYDPNTIGQRER